MTGLWPCRAHQSASSVCSPSASSSSTARWGTMFQRHSLDRGRLPGRAFPRPPARPQGRQRRSGASRGPTSSRSIHRAYLDAGADIIETNTFNATRISQADYGLEDRGLRAERGGRPHRRRASRASTRERDPGRPRFVAGAIGPTNRTLSISPERRTIPAFRAIDVRSSSQDAYAEQVRALVDGGVDLLLAETSLRHRST